MSVLLGNRALVRRGFVPMVERSVKEKLGRCARCMRASALLFFASWGLVVVLAFLNVRSVAPVALATLLAMLSSGLLGAHSIAYLVRRGGVIPSPAPPETGRQPEYSGPGGGTSGVLDSRHGCGCGG